MRTLAQSFRRQLSFKKYGSGGYLDDEIDYTDARRPTLTSLEMNPQSQLKGTQMAIPQYQDIASKAEDQASTTRSLNYGQLGFNLAGSAFLANQDRNRDPMSNHHSAGYYENSTAMKTAMQGVNLGAKFGPVGAFAGGIAGGVVGYIKGKKLGQQARQEETARDSAFQKGRLLDMQVQQMQNPDFAQGNMNAQMFRKGGHLKENPAHFTDWTGHQMYGNGGKLNPPTAQDSLRVMNSSLALQNFYEHDTFHMPARKDLWMPELDTKSIEELRQRSAATYKKMSDPTYAKWNYQDYAKAYGLTPMAYMAALKKTVDDTKKNTKDLTYYKDLYPSKIDVTAPSALLDSRIPPQGTINYDAKPGYTGFPAGLVSAAYYYDPIAVKPAAMKTKQDWAYLNKTYNTPIPNQTPSTQNVVNTTVGRVTGNQIATSGTSAAVINSQVVPRIKRTNAFDRLQNQPFPNNSASNIQGQQVPIPQMTLPKQGGTPVYGPGNTIVGYSDKDRNFKQAYQYTGAPNNASNLQDKTLLSNPDALHEYLSKKDTYKFATGGSLAQNFLANQKTIGGTMTPMSKDTTIASGPTHEQGGIDLPAQGAQVEGGETTSGDYVFSKVLGFAQLHKPIAMSEGKIQNKPATAERITALQKLGERTKKLKSLQEHFKQALNLQ